MDDAKYYDAEKYWTTRLSRFGMSLLGVGNKGLSVDENKAMYRDAKEVFLDICAREAVDFPETRVLDIGAGNGFYAGVLRERYVKRYLGVDITDALFLDLWGLLPGLELQKLDITQEKPAGEFDLIIMIDVTQHITDNKKLSQAMQNLEACLSAGGVIIITSWLDDQARSSHYERSRSMEFYRKALPTADIGEPVPFRDKFIFSIRKTPND